MLDILGRDLLAVRALGFRIRVQRFGDLITCLRTQECGPGLTSSDIPGCELAAGTALHHLVGFQKLTSSDIPGCELAGVRGFPGQV